MLFFYIKNIAIKGVVCYNKKEVKLMIKIEQIIESAIEKEKAIGFLIKKGVLVEVGPGLHLFHGRVNLDGKNYFVLAGNSGEDAEHDNNKIFGLHTSTIDVAQKYAEARFVESLKNNKNMGQIEVHKIVPTTKNLMIFNSQKLFDMDEIEPYLSGVFSLSKEEKEEIRKNALSPKEQQMVQEAFKTIASNTIITSIMPELFKTKQDMIILKELLEICEKNRESKKPYVLDDDLEKYIQKTSKGKVQVEKRIREIGGAINVYQMLKEDGNIKTLVSKLQSGFDFTEDMTLNLKFFQVFLEKENIVGVKQKIWASDVIGQKNIDDYFFFDTQRVNTTKAVQKIEKDKKKANKAQSQKAF